MSVESVIFACLSGAIVAGVYAGLVYGRRRRQGEEFKPYVFGGTVLVGAVWGAAMALNGTAITVDNVEQALVTYGGLVVFTESVLKFLVSEYREWRG